MPVRLLDFNSDGDDPTSGPPLRAVAAAATTEPALNTLVREAVGRELITRLAARLDVPDGERRAAAFGTQMVGVVFSRYLLRLEPIASMSVDEVVARLGPSLSLALQAIEPAGRLEEAR